MKIECPACGLDITNEKTRCPRCGNPVPKESDAYLIIGVPQWGYMTLIFERDGIDNIDSFKSVWRELESTSSQIFHKNQLSKLSEQPGTKNILFAPQSTHVAITRYFEENPDYGRILTYILVSPEETQRILTSQELPDASTLSGNHHR